MTRYAIVNTNIKIVVNCITCKHRISPIPRRSGNFDCSHYAICRCNDYCAWEYIGEKDNVLQYMEES